MALTLLVQGVVLAVEYSLLCGKVLGAAPAC